MKPSSSPSLPVEISPYSCYSWGGDIEWSEIVQAQQAAQNVKPVDQRTSDVATNQLNSKKTSA